MQRTFLASKIHNCTLTGTHLNYMGSITIDKLLLETANIFPYEQVHVLNIDNGERLITYAIPAQSGSQRIELNGAAAHKGKKGDRLIILTYIQLGHSEDIDYNANVVFVDECNQLKEVCHYPIAKYPSLLELEP
jgi:aspartate 1-decarboxylase